MFRVQGDHWNFKILHLSISLLLLFQNAAFGLENQNYNMSTLCNRQANRQMYRSIAGCVLTAEGEENLDCVMTFQTDTILQKFMLRFEHLAFDCNDHLYIFDGAHALGRSKTHLSCRSTLADTGTIFTQSNFVTLKYLTDDVMWSGFRLVITAIRKPVAGCRGFSCLNDFCISRHLRCDSVNHCGDNSDETSHAFCSPPQSTESPEGLYSSFSQQEEEEETTPVPGSLITGTTEASTLPQTAPQSTESPEGLNHSSFSQQEEEEVEETTPVPGSRITGMTEASTLPQTEDREYTGVIGAKVVIPCNITPALSNDRVTLVIWFKDDSRTPIYTVDARRDHIGDARHFIRGQLGSRATLNISHEEAILAINPIRENDGGGYRCRVDFGRSRTINTRMKIIVVAPQSTEFPEGLNHSSFSQQEEEEEGTPPVPGSPITGTTKASTLPQTSIQNSTDDSAM